MIRDVNVERKIKSLLLNTYDSHSGAAIATYRLHDGLRKIGVESSMLVQRKRTTDPSVIQGGKSALCKSVVSPLKPYVDILPVGLYRERKKRPFSTALVPGSVNARIVACDPDVVHLFWINAGFIKVESLAKIRKPLVWTLHDMWPFTGGCHYDDECGGYKDRCGNCPQLMSESPRDLSRWTWWRKSRAWDDLPMTIVATSNWMAECARASSLFRHKRIEVLPNGIDGQKYQPLDKQVARAAFNLPCDKSLILLSAFSATDDPRKGFQYLAPMIGSLARDGWENRIEFVILGAVETRTGLIQGIKTHYISHFQDEISQVLLYSAVDVLVAPSRQENLSNTVMESMSCGTPVVAFRIGGMTDLITHLSDGYLADPFEHDDLANGIRQILQDTEHYSLLSGRARESAVKKYSILNVAYGYRKIYEGLVK